MCTTHGYVVGFTIDEQAVHPRPGDRDQLYDEFVAEYAYRRSAEVGRGDPNLFASDTDPRFAEGPVIVLAGIRDWARSEVLAEPVE